jgi:hypothetical protein
MGQALPARFASRGVQAVVMDTAYVPGRNELREGGDEVRGVLEGGVLLEPWIVAGVVEDLAAGPVIGELLQRPGSPGNVLSEGLSGLVTATIEMHRVVDGEPGVFPAQEPQLALESVASKRSVHWPCVRWTITIASRYYNIARATSDKSAGMTGWLFRRA